MVRKPTTWSIKGIEEDTRDIARAAAERDEQTIGSWIDYAIRVHGGQRPREDARDEEAGAEPAPTNTESQTSDTQPSAQGLTDRTVLDIIDRELEASTNRLDQALRPMGLALLDLAERMVSIERGGPGQGQIGSMSDRRQIESAEDQGPGEVADDDFGPEPLPQSFDEEDAELETPVLPAEDDAPSPPSYDLAPDIDSLGGPMLPVEELPVEQTDREREIDRRLRALAGEVEAVDAVDTDPPPPTGDLGPSEIVIDDAVAVAEAAPDLALPMAFRGLQQNGFDSGPIAAADEFSRNTHHQSGRKLRKALLGTTGLAAVLAFGLYIFASQIGLGPLRDNLDSRLKPAAHNIAEGVAHLWHEAERNISPLIQRASTAFLGAGRPEGPKPEGATRENTMDDAVEASPPSDVEASAPSAPAQSVQPGSGEDTREAAVPDSMAQKAEPVPSGETGNEPRIAESAPVEPALPARETAALPSVEETVPSPEGVIAPPPAPSELPVPVPNAAPAPKVSEAPPPAPALPAPRSSEAADTKQSTPPAGALPQEERQSLEQRADAGDAKAQHDLALAYLTGAAGSENPERAAELLREAAIQGLPAAQYNLAVLYETGQGVRQDDVRALLWYHSAAEQGHPNAQYNLGVMYAEGRGIPLNFGEAARWFKAAANQGMSRALYNLAVLTDEGLGVKQDKEKALELFRAAADAGDQRAIEMLSGDGATAIESGTGLTGADGLSAGAGASAAIVAEVQTELSRLGFYSGRIDGLIGPKTRSAIRDFERTAGMEQRGEATNALLEKLKAAKP